MSGKKFQLTPLEARKQMLLTESELNRIQLLHEWNELKTAVHRLTDPIHEADVLVSSAATRVGGVISFLRRTFFRNGAEKSDSWLSTLAGGVEAGVSLWKKIQSLRRKK